MATCSASPFGEMTLNVIRMYPASAASPPSTPRSSCVSPQPDASARHEQKSRARSFDDLVERCLSRAHAAEGANAGDHENEGIRPRCDRRFATRRRAMVHATPEPAQRTAQVRTGAGHFLGGA